MAGTLARASANLRKHIERLGVIRLAGRRRQRPLGKKQRETGTSPGSAGMEPPHLSEAVKRVFNAPVSLAAVCYDTESFPTQRLEIPEIAVAGRSNVGKSSFLKALAIKRMHIPTQDRPGTTRSVDFYELGRKLRVVDLPGYGFAYAREELQQKWADTIDHYLRERKPLKRVMLLIDSRHGLKQGDLEFIEKLEEYRRRFQIVLTKADLLKIEPLARVAEATKEAISAHRQAHSELLICSSLNGGGISEVRAALGSLIPQQTKDSSGSTRKKLKPTSARTTPRPNLERIRARREMESKLI